MIEQHERTGSSPAGCNKRNTGNELIHHYYFKEVRKHGSRQGIYSTKTSLWV
jgi:hypothetical protein